MNFTEAMKKLQEPFPESDVEWRIQSKGLSKKNNQPYAMVLAYITNRAIMQRLDDLFGIMGWKNEFKEGPNGGLLCGISIKDDNGEWVTKWDGADNTAIEEVKGGLSGAMKRAAVQWGIGRYLYKLESNFANFHDKGKEKVSIEKKYYKYDNPKLPEWALPNKAEPTNARPARKQNPHAQANYVDQEALARKTKEVQEKELKALDNARKSMFATANEKGLQGAAVKAQLMIYFANRWSDVDDVTTKELSTEELKLFTKYLKES